MNSNVLKWPQILIALLIVFGSGLAGRSASPARKSRKRLKFHVVLMGEIVDKKGTEAGFRTDGFSYCHFGITSFEASDGEKLDIEYGEFRSPEEAKRYFDWRAARSSRILTQGRKMDHKGRSVGYRAEVLLVPDQKLSAVIWTDGAMYRQITANSLADALELEKRYGH